MDEYLSIDQVWFYIIKFRLVLIRTNTNSYFYIYLFIILSLYITVKIVFLSLFVFAYKQNCSQFEAVKSFFTNRFLLTDKQIKVTDKITSYFKINTYRNKSLIYKIYLCLLNICCLWINQVFR